MEKSKLYNVDLIFYKPRISANYMETLLESSGAITISGSGISPLHTDLSPLIPAVAKIDKNIYDTFLDFCVSLVHKLLM